MQITIIIVTYNGEQWIKKCIQSVLDSSIKVTIVIIDNDSTDKTLQIIKNNFNKSVILIKEKQNLGFGAANNIGLSYAIKNNADYVFLLNQDAYVEVDTIEKLVITAKKYPEYGILSPIHFNGNGSRLDRNFSYYMSYDKNQNFYSDYIKSQVKELYEVPFVNAAAWLLPIKTIEKIGGFDPIFYHYGEDDNYCQRVLYQGSKIGIATDAIVYHDREQRTQRTIIPFSLQYFNNFDKSLKVKYANINNEFTLKDKKIEKILALKNVLKSIVRFKSKSVVGYYKQYKMLSKIFSEIEKSRLKNVNKNPNVL